MLLAWHVLTSRYDPRFLADLASTLHWENVHKIVESGLPSLDRLKKGDMGEVITDYLLETHLGYRIPVRKLRYRITKNQSLPGTDTIGIKVDSNQLTELCYVETKFRTRSDKSAAVQGFKQLADDHKQEFPSMVLFVLSQLKLINDPLYEIMMNFMRDKRDDPGVETFRIGLVWEKSEWSEETLSNLEAEAREKKLGKLHVHVCHVTGLGDITSEVFREAGFVNVDEAE